MKLSIGPRILQGLGGCNHTVSECLQVCKKVGFDTFDFGILSRVGSCLIYYDDWEARAKNLAEESSKLGVTFFQSHAPYAFFMYNDLDFYREITRRTFEVAAILGAKYIVIHADLKPKKDEVYDMEKSLQTAYEFYAPFVELGKKLGVGVAIENLFEIKNKYIFTAKVEEQLAIIQKFNDESVSACWDFGHGYVMHGENHLNELRKLGNLLTCTHVSDNTQKKDLHLIPFMGDINWKDVIAYLKKIGYSGTFNFELKLGAVPAPLLDSYLKLIYDTGSYLLTL